MNFSKLLIVLTALIFLIYGILFALFPISLLDLVVNGAVTSASGVIDMRATYGGMSFAVGCILLVLTKSADTIKTGLMNVFLLMFCMAAGRFIGICVDQNANAVMYVYLILEVIVAALSVLLLNVQPKLEGR